MSNPIRELREEVQKIMISISQELWTEFDATHGVGSDKEYPYLSLRKALQMSPDVEILGWGNGMDPLRHTFTPCDDIVVLLASAFFPFVVEGSYPEVHNLWYHTEVGYPDPVSMSVRTHDGTIMLKWDVEVDETKSAEFMAEYALKLPDQLQVHEDIDGFLKVAAEDDYQGPRC